jgi:hypothetical protein
MVSSGLLRRVPSIYQVFLRSVRRLLVAACVVLSAPIFVTLMKEAPGSSETSVLTRATRRNNPEDTILHNLNCFALKVDRQIVAWHISRLVYANMRPSGTTFVVAFHLFGLILREVHPFESLRICVLCQLP